MIPEGLSQECSNFGQLEWHKYKFPWIADASDMVQMTKNEGLV